MALYEQIQLNLDSLSPKLKTIADYFLSHFDTLAYESAESIAEAVGVSSITVGRYLRQLGFQNMDDFRLQMKKQKAMQWHITDRLNAHHQRDTNLDSQNSLDIQHLNLVHQLRNEATYQKILNHLKTADAIYIIGLQSCSGLMMYFHSLLEYMRTDVYYSDSNSGAFLQAFNNHHKNPYVLTADVRTYAIHTQRLFQAAEKRGIDYAFITDIYCPWSRSLNGDVLHLETDIHQFWDSAIPLIAVLQCLLNDLANLLGSDLQQRILQNKQLQDHFQQFEKSR